MSAILRLVLSSCCGCALLTTLAIAQAPSPVPEVLPQPLGDRIRTPFDRAAVIITATVSGRCETATTGDRVEWVERQSPISFGTDTPDVIQLNGRLATDPDPSSGGLTIVQSLNSRFIELTLGEGYLLLLNPAPISRMLRLPEPLYVFAVPQGGFRMDRQGRLVPLVAGGELDVYRGRYLREVIAEIERRPKAPGVPH